MLRVRLVLDLLRRDPGDPSGSISRSSAHPNSGTWMSGAYSAVSSPSSSTSGGTRSRLNFFSSHDANQPERKPSGRKTAIPSSWPQIELSTLLSPVG